MRRGVFAPQLRERSCGCGCVLLSFRLGSVSLLELLPGLLPLRLEIGERLNSRRDIVRQTSVLRESFLCLLKARLRSPDASFGGGSRLLLLGGSGTKYLECAFIR